LTLSDIHLLNHHYSNKWDSMDGGLLGLITKTKKKDYKKKIWNLYGTLLRLVVMNILLIVHYNTTTIQHPPDFVLILFVIMMNQLWMIPNYWIIMLIKEQKSLLNIWKVWQLIINLIEYFMFLGKIFNLLMQKCTLKI